MNETSVKFNFQLKLPGQASSKFIELGIHDFEGAASYTRHLPFGRNPDKTNLLSLFNDHCGTCSTKHSLLKQVADEQQQNVRLILGIFNMDGNYSKQVGEVLKKAQLDYIPEAHMYLRTNEGIADYTNPRSAPSDFEAELKLEMEILPTQITDFKVAFHRNYLHHWISTENISYTLDEVWRIREECIAALSG